MPTIELLARIAELETELARVNDKNTGWYNTLEATKKALDNSTANGKVLERALRLACEDVALKGLPRPGPLDDMLIDGQVAYYIRLTAAGYPQKEKEG